MNIETNQARVVRKHYGLRRPITEQEVKAEISNLMRKKRKGVLDDSSSLLAARLGLL